MKILLSLLFVVLLVIGCASEKVKTSLDIPSEHIALAAFNEQVTGGLPSAFVKRKRYINLEMHKDQNYVNIVDKIINTHSRIYVLDKRGKTLAAFDSTGKYLTKIDSRTREFSNIADFDVDKFGSVYLVDGRANRVLHYSDAFNLMSFKIAPFDIDVIDCLPDGGFLFGLSSWNERDNKHHKLIRTNGFLEAVNTFLYYDDFVDHNFWITGYRFLKTDKETFYNKPLDNEVYTFSPAGDVKKRYTFDFGKMNVPQEDKKEIDTKVSRYDSYRLLSEFTFVNEQYALGRLWDKRKFRFFYADRNKRELYLEDLSATNELSHIMDFDGRRLLTVIYPGEYNENGFKELSDDARGHLKAGGLVLCEYEMNAE
ncbi:6-bladed beta-propeller [Chitinophaga rhizophila]|uniref:6-bladed beta-propeller n=1 Tax=Chitinophaga rhizophila TaxID=2866212 RepID=A0ABS7GDI4_9BACT|nr:6-bladed beta-propeller [Chitinophaga rhizophila]MBW8685220.1 6-bladed beta-propeller [Chitinophaga rhizophila]